VDEARGKRRGGYVVWWRR